ncbi:pilus assembly protein Flp/PilA [Pseudarthrobacter siccitolerans]|uniref:Pilus assembly protein Flp/PilA n=1 Tax=Pseudarthrobacter siccitolerans TaxID=861266 RepID=A0ABU0PIA8_9MICC|nr:Flp family type IVb pilin [Pseudarthrobacter siccitolerans]MDQ0673690.1 pilus assembly protein Flp/PilA [Pseudarthrobacter siccitolerans]
MLQIPVNVPSSVAMFFSELVQGQLPPLAQESQMLSLYTNLMIRLQTNEKGATAVEYGIMVALIAVVIIVAVTFLGDTLTTLFGQVSCDVQGKGAYIPPAGTAGSSCAP